LSTKIFIKHSDGLITTESGGLNLEMKDLGSAPSSTTDKVYNVGGTLFWNGTALTVAGGSIIGSPTDESWGDGALVGKDEAYDTHYTPVTGISATDTVPDVIDDINELIHNVYKSTYVRHAKFSANTLAGPATLTTTFTVDPDVYGGYDADSYEWNFGDGSAIVTTASTSHQFDYTGTAGGQFDVTLTARNTTAPVGTTGSYATFKRENYIIVYTPAPVALFTYAYNQVSGSVGSTSHTITPADIDETSVGSQTTNEVTFDITDSTNTTHWVIDFGDGTYFPANADPAEDDLNIITGAGADKWAVYSSTKITTHQYAITTQDLEKSVVLHVFSLTAGAQGALAISSTLNMRIMKDYTNLLSFTTSPTPAENNNDTASWNSANNGINTEGVYIEFTPALSGGNAVTGSYGTELSWNLADANNSEGETPFAYSATLAQQDIVLTRTDNINPAGVVTRVVALSLTSEHTSSPFSAGNTTVTIKRDPRADFTGQFDTLTSGQTGSSNQKGFVFTDYLGNDRNIITFTDSSDDNGILDHAWTFGDSNTSTTQSPQHTYASTGTYTVELTLNHPNTYGSNDVDYKKTIPSYITISSNPTAPASLAGKTITITNDGTYTARLCNGVTNHNSSETAPSAGTIVTRTEDTTPTSFEHSYANEFPSDGDNTGDVRAVINGVEETGNVKTFTTGNDTGTTGSLIITSDIDASASGSGTQNTIPDNWYRVFKSKVESTSALSPGINTYAIKQLYSSSPLNTAVVQFVVDTMTTAPAVQSGYTVGLDSIGTPRYMSQIRYFNSGGSLSITDLDISDLSGQTYADEDPLEITYNTGSLLSATTKPYANITGISTPLDLNNSPTGLSTTVNVSGSNEGIGTIKLRSQNVNGWGSYQTDSTNSLYWYSSPNLDEESMDNDVGFGTAISGKPNLIRIHGFDDASATPAYPSGAENFYANKNWVSATRALGTYEAPLLYTSGGQFTWDNTNWKTYLPGLTNNPDNSTRGAGVNQFVTLVFCRKSIQEFTIRYTGTIASLWIALPGLATDASSNYNGWLDCNTNYGGAGLPGSLGIGNGSDGVRDPVDGGTATIGVLESGATFILNLGTASTGGAGSIALDCPVLIRFGLASGKNVSSINVEGEL